LIPDRHRLEAAKLLGWEQIVCEMLDLDETERRMWEIAENLHRAELTQLEHDERLAQWMDLAARKQLEERLRTKNRGNLPML
jgi:ParB family transcriptional regulator, chromosome partitioning protein